MSTAPLANKRATLLVAWPFTLVNEPAMMMRPWLSIFGSAARKPPVFSVGAVNMVSRVPSGRNRLITEILTTPGSVFSGATAK